MRCQEALAWSVEAEVSKDHEGEHLAVPMPSGLVHLYQYVHGPCISCGELDKFLTRSQARPLALG